MGTGIHYFMSVGTHQMKSMGVFTISYKTITQNIQFYQYFFFEVICDSKQMKMND